MEVVIVKVMAKILTHNQKQKLEKRLKMVKKEQRKQMKRFQKFHKPTRKKKSVSKPTLSSLWSGISFITSQTDFPSV